MTFKFGSWIRMHCFVPVSLICNTIVMVSDNNVIATSFFNKICWFFQLLQRKIIPIHKILAFLLGFNIVNSEATIKQSGIWLRLLVTSYEDLAQSSLPGDVSLGFKCCESIFGIIGNLSKMVQDFWMKELYHIVIQFGVYLQ